jgi:hypothetical protein
MPDDRGALPTGLRHANLHKTDVIMTQIRGMWISTAAGLAPLMPGRDGMSVVTAGAAAIR